MKKLMIGIAGLMALGVLLVASTTHAQSAYTPYDYINQMYLISNKVDYDNWSAANPYYQKLGSVCRQIKADYPRLAESADDCISATATIVRGSICDGNCHTDYNRKVYGPIVDRGLRELDVASQTLANFQ